VEPRDRTRENADGHSRPHTLEAFEHDIRTPLTVIYGQVQLLQRRLDKGHLMSNDDLQRSLHSIDRAARSIEAHLSARTHDIRRTRYGADDQ
jgi:signal transduction histidine kinase